jgi:hypothetical protein
LRNAQADATLPGRVRGTVFRSQDQSAFLRALGRASKTPKLIDARRWYF